MVCTYVTLDYSGMRTVEWWSPVGQLIPRRRVESGPCGLVKRPPWLIVSPVLVMVQRCLGTIIVFTKYRRAFGVYCIYMYLTLVVLIYALCFIIYLRRAASEVMPRKFGKV